MQRAVFLDQETMGSDISLDALSSLFSHWQTYLHTTPEQIVQRCCDAQVIVVNKVVLSKTILTKLPKLKLIAVAATGTNNIDDEAAKSLGITVVNTQGYAAPSVAQHCFNLILQLAGRSAQYQQFISDGGWQRSRYFCNLDHSMMELNGKTFGVVGYGSLGQATAAIARAFGMTVLVSERPNAQSVRDDRVSFSQLLSDSDIISLHCPLTDDTSDMINEASLNQMKPTALLINTARGGLVDESALVKALTNNRIGGAALDVISQEPPVNGSVLLDYAGNNLIITPHIAWATVEARQRLVSILANNIKKTLTS